MRYNIVMERKNADFEQHLVKRGVLHMKKLVTLTIAALMALSLAACGSTASSQTASSAAQSTASTASTADGAIASADDLTGKKIGVQTGTTGDIYAEDVEGATIERYSKGADAIMALTQGKIDAVIIDDQPAKVFEAQNDSIKVLGEPFTVEDYAMCISKDKADLTKSFNEAIAALKADGMLQSIIDYYIGEVEGSKPYESPADVSYTNGKLIMATNAAFPPYEYVENDTVCGLDADFAKAICDYLGYELQIDDMEFDSIITAVQSGKADFGAAGMSVTEDRLKSIDFTDSYCTGTQAIIVAK